MRTAIAKVISGGQAGADRGALDAAIALGVPHGGWCPKGRLAEDGQIPARHCMRETVSVKYRVRTERNVRDSHATLVFTDGPPKRGSSLTIRLADEYCRPVLHVDLARDPDDLAVARRVLAWLKGGGLESPSHPPPPPNPVLNVAGSRESATPGIQKRVEAIMRLVLDYPGYAPGGE